MKIDYLYCKHCDTEIREATTVEVGPKRAFGVTTVICPECGQETSQFEREVENNKMQWIPVDAGSLTKQQRLAISAAGIEAVGVGVAIGAEA